MVKFLFKMKNKGITTMNIGELLLVANLSTHLFTSALRYTDLILSSFIMSRYYLPSNFTSESSICNYETEKNIS